MPDTLKIAEKGKALLPIVIADDADRVVRFAARELQAYLKKITGALFSVKPESAFAENRSTPAIILGVTTLEKDRGLDLDPCRDPFDGFTLKTDGHQLFIRGHNSRSTLYGVYALLETIGCRYVEPGIEHIPSLKNLELRIHTQREVASFPLRNVFRNILEMRKSPDFRFMDPTLVLPQIDWMAKKRLNYYEFYVDYYRFDLWEQYKGPVLDALLDRGFDLELTHHSLRFFCPQEEKTDFGDYGPSTYLARHPEWYVPVGSGWQIRVERPDVRRLVTKRFLEFYSRNPELNIVSLWPDDLTMNKPIKGLNQSDGYLKAFWNKVSHDLAREMPGKFLGIIAYFELIKPPVKVRPEPNQHCWFCPINRDYRYLLTDRRNRRYVRYLRGWTQKISPYHLGIFEYYGWSALFLPFYDMMKEDLTFYQELGVGGIYGWAGFAYNTLGENYRWAPDLNVLAGLLWNVKSDPGKIMQLWAHHVFGQAAGPVLDFYAYMRRTFYNTIKNTTDNDISRNMYRAHWLTIERLHPAQAILKEARKAASTPEARRRVDLMEKELTIGLKAPPPLPGDLNYPGV